MKTGVLNSSYSATLNQEAPPNGYSLRMIDFLNFTFTTVLCQKTNLSWIEVCSVKLPHKILKSVAVPVHHPPWQREDCMNPPKLSLLHGDFSSIHRTSIKVSSLSLPGIICRKIICKQRTRKDGCNRCHLQTKVNVNSWSHNSHLSTPPHILSQIPFGSSSLYLLQLLAANFYAVLFPNIDFGNNIHLSD